MVRKRSGVPGLVADLQSLATWVNTSLLIPVAAFDGISSPSTDLSSWENGLLNAAAQDERSPLRTSIWGAWLEDPDAAQHLEVRAPMNQSDAIMLVRRNSIQRQAIGLWLSGPAELKAIFHEWGNVATSERTLRALKRARQRASLDQEIEAPCVPEQMSQALGAFLCFSEVRLRGCFHGWRHYVDERRRRTETTKWLMERLLFSQSRFVLQAALASWCHLSMHSRQPTWALALQHDVRRLMRLQLDEPGKQTKEGGAQAVKRIRRMNWSTVIAVLSLVCHLFAWIAWTQGGHWRVNNVAHTPVLLDSDHDGIPDEVDHCPFTPVKYKFRSSWQTDWDGDGCLDSVEDSDDDGDAVANVLDKCPRTSSLDVVDSDGCSLRQRETMETSATQVGPGITETVATKIGDAVFEAVVASLFMSAMGCAWTKRSDASAAITKLYMKLDQSSRPS